MASHSFFTDSNENIEKERYRQREIEDRGCTLISFETFLVLYESDPNKWKINDPSSGIVSYCEGERDPGHFEYIKCYYLNEPYFRKTYSATYWYSFDTKNFKKFFDWYTEKRNREAKILKSRRDAESLQVLQKALEAEIYKSLNIQQESAESIHEIISRLREEK